jgi:hypothetical protein
MLTQKIDFVISRNIHIIEIMKHIHHIIPKHAGGTDDPSNLIELTVKEHAEAHLWLWLKYGRWEDRLAWKALSGQIGKEEIILQKQIENGREQGRKSVESGHLDRVRDQAKATKAAVLAGAPSKAGKVGGPIGGRKHVESGHWKIVSDIGRRKGLITSHTSEYQRNRALGRKWINKDGEDKRVHDQDLHQYLEDGWIRGRTKKAPR